MDKDMRLSLIDWLIYWLINWLFQEDIDRTVAAFIKVGTELGVIKPKL